MGKNLNMSLLMDFYGQLLTPKQIEALEYYYNDDLSLGEIADEMGISRQGSRDFIKRGEKQLVEFEQKLGLASRFESIKNKVEQIDYIIKALNVHSSHKESLTRLHKLVEEVIEEL